MPGQNPAYRLSARFPLILIERLQRSGFASPSPSGHGSGDTLHRADGIERVAGCHDATPPAAIFEKQRCKWFAFPAIRLPASRGKAPHLRLRSSAWLPVPQWQNYSDLVNKG